MSLTRIGSIGINTGIAFAGVTTIVTLNTANDALSIGATVNVGSGITLGASGDIFATGVSTFSGNLKVGSGVTISPDGDGFYTGVVTATTFSGALAASNLTGALPAISGANLTNLDASDLASGTVPTARLGSGTASSSTFLRGDSTFQTVNTDLVSDTSPQLGGTLDTNSNNITFADNVQAIFGTGNDSAVRFNGTDLVITTAGKIKAYGGDTGIEFYSNDNSETLAKFIKNGAVELYYNNVKKLATTSNGIKLNDSTRIGLGDGEDLQIVHNGSDSQITDTGTGSLALGGSAVFIQNASHNANMASFVAGAEANLFHNGSKKFETTSSGATVTGELKAGTNSAATIPSIRARILVVGGGGGGGTTGGEGGGGGAGGFQEYSNLFLVKGEVYTVVIGGGGSGTSAYNVYSGKGAPSSIKGSNIGCMPCAGGGGGGTYPGQTPYGKRYGAGQDGASGGGGAGNYGGGGSVSDHTGGRGIGGQGFNGGAGGLDGGGDYGGGGGGGAGEDGESGSLSDGSAGNGGDGLPSAITGSVTYYAGGGAGNSTTTDGTGGNGGGGNTDNNGTANTGGGAGAGSGKNGGSGVVIISLLTSDYSSTTSGSPTVTTSGSNTIIKFTGSGTYTA